jgi:nitrite reductase/ring-hydroxylating ferredoxin subunit
MGTYVKVARCDEIEDQTGKLVEVEGKRIALFRVGLEFYALDNECTHLGGPLCEGMIIGDEVSCPWHAARFNLKTGADVAGPTRGSVASYPVRFSGEDVEIEV